MSTELPPVAPEVLAEAVEHLTPRLRKKLDAATEGCAAGAVLAADGTVTLRFGEDALVTLSPGPAGTVTTAEQATCSCLLAPRCLHRAAALGAAPLADSPPEPTTAAEPAQPAESADPIGSPEPVESVGTVGTVAPVAPVETTEPAPALTAAQLRAAGALWHVAAEALAAGVTAGGAVVQAELLRAAHTARLAGLPRAEAAALRVVRGLRAARERRAGQRLGDLTGAFRELLHTAGMLASGAAGPALTGTARRAYAPGGSLQVYGLCREPVLSATGYGGVVTHLLAPDGTPYSVSDVRPGGLARARGAGSASVALGGAILDHAGLARGGLRIVGATVSPEGRLGAGRGVRATPLPGTAWTEQPAAPLFARPAAEAVAGLLAAPDAAESALLGCDVTVVGAAGEHLLVRETRPDSPLLRLLPAHPHPELAHTENLRRIASYPGLLLRVLGRPDLDRTATLRPLAVGPVPGAEYTLRLPEEWLGRADLGYDRLQGAHFPQGAAAVPVPLPAAGGPDPLADSPLWRVRRLLETGVAGGRRAVAEAARGTASLAAASYGPLRRAGLTGAADLAAALAAEADRRPRDVFGRLADPSPDGYAWAWLAAATHLAAAERCLIAASWAAAPSDVPVSGR
ncbi:SWIM zinc finger family protein [Streptomyces sp. DSM 40907]|uniref:SWIM zinc finger family protein n=1 Tax=Streptomyces kutzneri TaxID=3051179 RepID=UPI0028D812AE|nr:SWIM zinc finger family protein [Streptomyces sp. DSM 40907]